MIENYAPSTAFLPAIAPPRVDKRRTETLRDARAQVAELVDALVSGTSGAIRGGSSPLLGTIKAR